MNLLVLFKIPCFCAILISTFHIFNNDFASLLILLRALLIIALFFHLGFFSYLSPFDFFFACFVSAFNFLYYPLFLLPYIHTSLMCVFIYCCLLFIFPPFTIFFSVIIFRAIVILNSKNFYMHLFLIVLLSFFCFTFSVI